jgi:hypothetical protein
MTHARGYYLYRSGGGLSCLVDRFVCLLQLAQRLPALVRTNAAVRAEAVDFVNEWRHLSVHSQVGPSRPKGAHGSHGRSAHGRSVYPTAPHANAATLKPDSAPLHSRRTRH